VILCNLAHAAATEKPNVVLIYADDLGWGDVGYHGVDDIDTPNIDRLAAGGVHFTQGYVSASVCGPSRVGLMTGVYQQRLGAGENPNSNGFPEEPHFPFAGCPRSQPLLSEMLKPHGYRCGAVGKWHLGLNLTMRPLARGFDSFYGFLNGAHDYERALPKFTKNKSLWPLFRDDKKQPAYEGYLTDTFSDEAVRFVEQNSDSPFFLYVAYNAVHHPWQVPPKYLKRVKHLSDSEDRRFFAAMVLAMDDGIGRIVSAIDEAGAADRTLIFFISDNGTPRGQGLVHAPKDNRKERGGCTMSSPGPFRGFKGDTFEGGIRVPFLMHWPARIAAGQRYELPVSTLDVVPTVLAQLGAAQPTKGFAPDGVDLMPFLEGKREGERPHDVLLWRRDSDYAIRAGDWKLAWNDHSCKAGSRAMLFNLADDPGEYNDLSHSQPEIARKLQTQFDAWDRRLPPSHCWGVPFNRKPPEDRSTQLTRDEDAQILTVDRAILHGHVMQKGDDVISHWRESTEWIEWQLTAAASGPHHVVLDYAAPHSSIAQVGIGRVEKTARLPERRDWGDTAEQVVARVHLQAGRSYRLTIKPSDQWRAINLHRVILRKE